jgi:hypothetical protein
MRRRKKSKAETSSIFNKKDKSDLPPVKEENQELNLEIPFDESIVEIDYNSMEEELKKRRQQLEDKAEELKDSEQLMNKIVKSFLNNTDELSKKFNEDLEKVNSLDLKLLKIQNKLKDVLSENAFYSKETRRLKVILTRISPYWIVSLTSKSLRKMLS